MIMIISTGWPDSGSKPMSAGLTFPQNTNPFGTSPSNPPGMGQVFSGTLLSQLFNSSSNADLNCLDNNNDLFAAAPKPFISEKPGTFKTVEC